MPTVIERLSTSVSTGGLEQQLAAQAGALQQAIALAGPLLEGRTPDLAALVGSLGALRNPSFGGGGSFAGGLDQALALAPGDLGALVAPVGGRFTELAALVENELRPLLETAVRTAGAIQQLLNVRLGCLDGIAPSPTSPPTPPPAPPEPGDPPPPGRVALAAQQIQQLDSILAGLPTPIDAAVLLQLFLTLLGSKPRSRFFELNLPVIDDLLDPLQTLVAWAGQGAGEVAAHIATSLETLTGRLLASAAMPLDALASSLEALAPQWRSAELGAAADAVAEGLADLESALRAGNDAAATALLGTLDTALDTYDALRAAMEVDVLPAVPTVRALPGLAPGDLLDGLTHLLVLLESTNLASRVASLLPPFQAVPQAAVDAVRDAVQPLVDWLRDLVALLDFGSAQTEIAEVAQTATALAAEIESALTGVGLEVQSAFSEVRDAVASVGLDDLRDDIAGQITQFGEQLRRDVAQAFAPARAGTSAAIGAVSDALDAFDPAVIVDALEDVVEAIAGVLNGSDVKGAIDAVKQAMDAVVEALRALSFQPVTDEVVALIETMRAGLKAIIDKDLNDATKSALSAAMSFLPGDLHPATDPLVEDFGKLIDAGPIAVLNQVKDAPKRLLDEIKRFEPAALVGDQLSAPFRELLGRADEFEAAKLFAAADQELEQARRRLLQTASPGRALEPLRAPVQQLFTRLDAFSAEALLAPLTAKVEETVAQIVEASPVDEILAVIAGVFGAVQDVLAFAEQIESVATRTGEIFDAFANADDQLDTWRDALLAKVPNTADAALQSALAALDDALDSVRHADVLSAFDAATQAVLDELEALDPAARLGRIVTAYGRLAGRVSEVDNDDLRDGVEAILARFNPLDPAQSAPLRLAGDVRSRIAAARSALVALAAEWTETAEGFASLAGGQASTLREQVAAAIEPVLQPVRFLFRSLGNAAAPVNGVVATLAELVSVLTDQVGALVSGPGSLSAISDAVQQVVDLLRNIDLDFVGRSLDQVLLEVRDQLRALDPTQLADELDAAFEQALSGLSLASVIPPEEIAALDLAWQGVIDKLGALDPGELVEQAVQPIYDETVLPLLEAFDLTPVFAALIDFLESLEGELSTGLDQVNTAYQSFIALRPGESGASASVGG